jgi:Calpain family cysteine protease
VDEISKSVDELLTKQLGELTDNIAIRAMQLEKDGYKLNLTLKDTPSVFVKDLDVTKYSDSELGMIDRDLRLLNADIYDSVKYLQEGIE